jgi:SAM-dependent methyltransferase
VSGKGATKLNEHRQPALEVGTCTIVNLGCGARTSSECINVDFSPYLRLKSSRVLRILARPWLSEARLRSLNQISGEVICHDLRNGIPFGDCSVDVVYHSHFLEHLPRAAIEGFLAEVGRVLRPGGVQRIVVPDLEALVRSYLASLEASRRSAYARSEHDRHIGGLYEQVVREEPVGTSRQPRWRRLSESVLRGGARNQGENHRWMYDEMNLKYLLEAAGFRGIRSRDCHSSVIEGWSRTMLDVDTSGREYRKGSLYMEAMRPGGQEEEGDL